MADTATDNQDTSGGGDEGSTSRRLARIYAESLLNAADKAGKADALEGELDGLLTMLNSNPKIASLLSSRGIQHSQRDPFLKQAFEGKVDPLLLDFIGVLNRKDRLDLLADAAIGYRELQDERAHRVRVLVKSPRPLDDDQKETLKRILESSLRMTPVLDVKIDPELLGGLVVQVGDVVYDNSVRTRIDTLRNQLLSRSSYEIQIGRDRFSSAG